MKPAPNSLGSPDPPGFVMWRSLPEDPERSWDRQWFGHELSPDSLFNIRGIGIREPMFNENITRPLGTGDWLIMFFHQAARLDPKDPNPTSRKHALIIWPPGSPQFYSWGTEAETEIHSWMHVEGSWVADQIRSTGLPVNQAFPLSTPGLMERPLENLLNEMREGRNTDVLILQNLFQNWARTVARDIRSTGPHHQIPAGILRVQRLLDENFSHIPPLDDLAQLAAMSRSHLCHRFRHFFGSSISEYVIRNRIAAAQRMLFDVNLRPGEIARAVGYTDIFQFSKQFKKSLGMSPTQFRKKQLIQK